MTEIPKLPAVPKGTPTEIFVHKFSIAKRHKYFKGRMYAFEQKIEGYESVKYRLDAREYYIGKALIDIVAGDDWAEALLELLELRKKQTTDGLSFKEDDRMEYLTRELNTHINGLV